MQPSCSLSFASCECSSTWLRTSPSRWREWSTARTWRQDPAWGEADRSPTQECVLHVKGSKTDQYNVGDVRNQYATQSTPCSIAALAAMRAQHPQRFDRDAEARLPLFLWASGALVKREEVQHFPRVG
eukprot:7464871-Pyramimonas_sp.AAC.1